MITAASGLVTRHGTQFGSDPTRVITKLFVPGEEIPENRSRAAALIGRVLALPESAVAGVLADVLADFSGRHSEFSATLRRNASIMSHRIVNPESLSPQRRLLLGAYFTHEYSVEAAALCNPSLVPHPRQDGLGLGQLRVALSVRGIGEGHLSSIGFAEGVLGPGTQVRWQPRTGPVRTAERQPDVWDRDWFRAALAHDQCDNEITATVLSTLPQRFGQPDLDGQLAALHHRLRERSGTETTIRRIRELTAASYTARFPDDTSLAGRVLWPTSSTETHGMEDARFVHRTALDGTTAYRATYTAYNGLTVAPQLLESADLNTFHAVPLTGPAARNKGMALFPRPVGGRYLALCRGTARP